MDADAFLCYQQNVFAEKMLLFRIWIWQQGIWNWNYAYEIPIPDICSNDA